MSRWAVRSGSRRTGGTRRWPGRRARLVPGPAPAAVPRRRSRAPARPGSPPAPPGSPMLRRRSIDRAPHAPGRGGAVPRSRLRIGPRNRAPAGSSGRRPRRRCGPRAGRGRPVVVSGRRPRQPSVRRQAMTGSSPGPLPPRVRGAEIVIDREGERRPCGHPEEHPAPARTADRAGQERVRGDLAGSQVEVADGTPSAGQTRHKASWGRRAR